MSFNALIVERDEDTKQTSAAVQSIELDRLPEGDVVVAVEYSTVNYKDGLCLTSGGGLVRNYPHVPGIDFAGTVESSQDDRYKPGDKVVLTGWRVGEVNWGGYAQKARVKAEWLVPLPAGLDTRAAMAVGTAGFTAMLSGIVRSSIVPIMNSSGTPTSDASSIPSRIAFSSVPSRVRTWTFARKNGTAHATPSTPRTRCSAVSRSGNGASTVFTLGSMTQMSASRTSLTTLDARP